MDELWSIIANGPGGSPEIAEIVCDILRGKNLDPIELRYRIYILEEAIREHREAVQCCDECSEALIADANTSDGKLWSKISWDSK